MNWIDLFETLILPGTKRHYTGLRGDAQSCVATLFGSTLLLHNTSLYWVAYICRDKIGNVALSVVLFFFFRISFSCREEVTVQYCCFFCSLICWVMYTCVVFRAVDLKIVFMNNLIWCERSVSPGCGDLDSFWTAPWLNGWDVCQTNT